MTDMMIDNFYHTIKKCPSLSYSFGVYNYEVELLRQPSGRCKKGKTVEEWQQQGTPKKKNSFTFWKK